MPELTPEQKAQLDKNIRNMLSQGASETDVMTYSNDFRTKYDTALKKKDGTVSLSQEELNSPTGTEDISQYKLPFSKSQSGITGFMRGAASAIPEKLESKSNDKMAQELGYVKNKDGVYFKPESLQTIEQKKKSPIKDPVGDIINPLEEEYNKSDKIYKSRYGGNRLASDMTAQQPLIKSLPKEKEDRQIVSSLEKSTKDLDEVSNVVMKNVFPSPLDARDYLNLQLSQHPIEDLKDNKTVQLAYNKVQQYENVKKRYAETNDINQLAVDLEREADPNFDKQLTVLEGGENDRKLDKYEFVLPGSVHGAMVERVRNDPNLKALAYENPTLRQQMDELEGDNLYKKYPDRGEIVARNILSREYQKRKANKVINPIFNKSSYLNGLAEELFKDRPVLMDIYKTRLKDNWEGKIDTPGMVDEFATGAKEAVVGMGESFKDLIGAGKSESERIEQGLKQQYEHVDSGVSGGWKKLGQAFHFGGMLTAMAATGSPLRGLGVNPKVVHGIVTGGTFFDQEKNAATMKYPGEPWKANLEAGVMTGLYTFGVRNGLPKKQIGEIVSKARPELSEALKNMSAEAVESEIKNGTLNAVEKGVGGILGGTGEMILYTSLGNGLDEALGLNGDAMKKYHPDSEIPEVSESMLVGLAGPHLLSAIKDRKATSNSLYNIAEYPQRYKDILTSSPDSPDLQKKLENIDFLSGLKKELDAQGITEPNQKRFLIEALNEKYAKEKIPQGTPESAVTRRGEKEIKRYQEVQDQILEGEDIAGKEEPTDEDKMHEEKPVVTPEGVAKPIEKNNEDSTGEQSNVGEVEKQKEIDKVNRHFFGWAKNKEGVDVPNTSEDFLKDYESSSQKERYDEYVAAKEVINLIDDMMKSGKSENEIVDAALGKVDLINRILSRDGFNENGNGIIDPHNIEQLKKAIDDGIYSNSKEGTLDPYNKRIKDIQDKYQPAKPTEQTINEATKDTNKGDEPKQAEEISQPEKPIPENLQPTKEGEGEPPKGNAPGETSITIPTEGERVGITHEQMNDVAKELGLPKYEGDPETVEQWDAQVEERLSKDPKAIQKMLGRLADGKIDDPVDQRMMLRYMASLKGKINEKPTTELLAEWKRARGISDISGRMWGKVGKARQGEKDTSQPLPDNLPDFLMGKEDVQGFPLSKEQIVVERAKFEELQKNKAELEDQLEKERGQHARMVAEYGINKAKAMTRKAAKKSNEEYAAERKANIDAAREALKGIRTGTSGTTATIPGVRELAVLVPHIKKHAKILIDQGYDKLDNIVTDLHAEFKDVLDTLTKSQVIDILAGKHDEVKETKNEKAAKLRMLEREAKLLGDIADARKGKEETKKQTVKDEKSRRIVELEAKLEEIRRQNKTEVKEKLEESNEERDVKEQEKLTKKIEKLQKDIKDGNYQKEEDKTPPLKMSRKTIQLKDKVIELEEKIIRERAKEDYKKRSPLLRAYDKTMQVLGIRRIVQTALDLSIPFRQGATLLPRRGGIWVDAFGKMMQSVFSPKNYSRMMYDIRHDEFYHDMVKDGIVFNELDSFKPENRNEDYQKSFIYHIPVVSEPLKASNRAADAFLNIARYELYMKGKQNLEAQGLTRQSDPKAYEFNANWAMNMTGRGRMIDALENPLARQILGNTFYGARLMASRFNLLNPITYFDPRVPKEIRFQAMKDMASYTTFVLASAYALSATTGATVSLNPWDGDFLQVRYGNKVYDLSGGLANYVRTFLRIADAGITKIRGTKYEGNKATEKAGMSILNFFRNKLSPNTSYATDAFFGAAYPREFDPYDVARIYPMYGDDVAKALKEDGLVSLATVLLPNLLGVGYGNYGSKGQIDEDVDTLIDRNARSDEMNKDLFKNYKDKGREITNKEFGQFADKRDEEIKKEITEMYNKGAWVIRDGKPKKIPYKELTKGEVIKETSNIKSAATKKVKEEMFGKEGTLEKIKKEVNEELIKVYKDKDKREGNKK